jgi:hypothetical protein
MMDGFASIVREGGVRGLFRGATAAMMRVCVGSAVQLSSYDLFKDSLRIHLGATGGAPCAELFVRRCPASVAHEEPCEALWWR